MARLQRITPTDRRLVPKYGGCPIGWRKTKTDIKLCAYPGYFFLRVDHEDWPALISPHITECAAPLALSRHNTVIPGLCVSVRSDGVRSAGGGASGSGFSNVSTSVILRLLLSQATNVNHPALNYRRKVNSQEPVRE